MSAGLAPEAREVGAVRTVGSVAVLRTIKPCPCCYDLRYGPVQTVYLPVTTMV